MKASENPKVPAAPMSARPALGGTEAGTVVTGKAVASFVSGILPAVTSLASVINDN